jgi:hypothetical protein
MKTIRFLIVAAVLMLPGAAALGLSAYFAIHGSPLARDPTFLWGWYLFVGFVLTVAGAAGAVVATIVSD